MGDPQVTIGSQYTQAWSNDFGDDLGVLQCQNGNPILPKLTMVMKSLTTIDHYLTTTVI